MSAEAATGAAGAAASTTPYGQIAGLGLGVGMSLYQASEQAGAARNFQAKQDQAIQEAKRQAGANFMQNISAPTEAYQAAMRQGTAQQMQALQAGTEGDVRNLQGIVGRTNEAATDFDFSQRDKMAKDLYDLHMAQAKEQKQSANSLAGIGLEEASGAGLAKQQAEKANALSNANALGGVEKLGLLWDNSKKAFPAQPNTQPSYDRATDPMLANINKWNTSQQGVVGPQMPPSSYDWSIFKQG